MGRIDDPLDQIEFQHRDEGGQALEVGLSLAAPVISLLTEPLGALASITAFAQAFTGQRRRESRAQAFQDSLREGFRDLEGRLETVEKKPARALSLTSWMPLSCSLLKNRR